MQGRLHEPRLARAAAAGTLHPYFPTDGASLPIITVPAADGSIRRSGVEITTPFVTLPDFVDAECAEHDGFVYLAITVNGDPADPRIDDIGGDLTPEWGMHLVDVNVAMGDLVAIASSQASLVRAPRLPWDEDEHPEARPASRVARRRLSACGALFSSTATRLRRRWRRTSSAAGGSRRRSGGW